jgi:signal transduction histidine kinase
MPQGLARKLRRVFVVQAALAGLAVVVVLYASSWLARDIMSEDRIREEAEKVWQTVGDGAGPTLPHSSRTGAYFVPAGDAAAAARLPAGFRKLSPGLYDVEVGGAPRRLLVEDREPGRLYLSMSFELVDRVAHLSVWTGSLLTLITICVLSWLSYRIARRMVAPVTHLAAEVAKWDPRAPDLDAIDPRHLPGEVGREVFLLQGALRGLAERMQAFVRRERDFTRDASHELRTPLTVVRVAADMLRDDADTPPRMQRSLRRIQLAGQDMETVIDAFLILAREEAPNAMDEQFAVNEQASLAIDAGRLVLEEKPGVELTLVSAARPAARGSARAMGVVIEHLVTNACNFTEEGEVEVRVEADRVVVRDTGIGMEQEILERAFEPFYRADQFLGGKGMGLTVAARLCERFQWVLDIHSVPGEGTVATVRFRPVAEPGGVMREATAARA